METIQAKIEPAVKYDGGKLRFDLLPPDALMEVVKIYNYGADKYKEPRNWEKGMSWSRVFGALMRHSWFFFRGETYDKESGLHHMAHAAWCCLALIEYTFTHPEMDDRPKREVL